jgi:hypothetical protein
MIVTVFSPAIAIPALIGAVVMIFWEGREVSAAPEGIQRAAGVRRS